MQNTVKVILLIILACVLCGFAYREYCSSQNYETYIFHEVLRTNETVEGVASYYYNPFKDPRSYDEYRYDIMERNKVYFLNGRMPQPGDIVCIEVRVKK